MVINKQLARVKKYVEAEIKEFSEQNVKLQNSLKKKTKLVKEFQSKVLEQESLLSQANCILKCEQIGLVNSLNSTNEHFCKPIF